MANSGKTSSVTSVSVKLRNVMFGQVLISALMSLSRTRSVARLIFSTVLVRYVHRLYVRVGVILYNPVYTFDY